MKGARGDDRFEKMQTAFPLFLVILSALHTFQYEPIQS